MQRVTIYMFILYEVLYINSFYLFQGSFTVDIKWTRYSMFKVKLLKNLQNQVTYILLWLLYEVWNTWLGEVKCVETVLHWCQIWILGQAWQLLWLISWWSPLHYTTLITLCIRVRQIVWWNKEMHGCFQRI